MRSLNYYRIMDLIDYSELHFVHRMPDDTNEWTGTMGEKPLIEQQLFQLQDDWYSASTREAKDEKWRAMLDLLAVYSASIVKEKLKKKKYMPPAELDSAAYTVACTFMNQYIYKPNYKVQASFYGLLEPRTRTVLFGPKNEDHCYSLDATMGDTEKSIGDLPVALKFRPIFDQELIAEDRLRLDITNVFALVEDLLHEFDFEIDDDVVSLKARLYIAFILKKPVFGMTNHFFSRCSNKERELFELLEVELVKRLRDGSDLSSIEFEDTPREFNFAPPKAKRGRKRKGVIEEEEEEELPPALYQF